MLSTGIDYHKRYSMLSTVDAEGNRVREARVEANSAEGFRRYFGALGEPSQVVLEACWNWAKLHEVLEDIEGVGEVVLAHPYKTRLIGEAQIKTDKIDARALATLLRGNLVARVHIPDKTTRQRKEVLRQRLYWARLRTRIRNRVHAVLDRQHHLQLPQCSDLFGRRGMTWLGGLELPEPDAGLLKQDLELFGLIGTQIKALEKQIELTNRDSHESTLLETIPGIGRITAAVVASEIDTIDRFLSSAKLCAYAGLVPTTHASGGKISHGRLLTHCNKWLRWALVESAWVAVGCDGYFGAMYRHHRQRGKRSNTAIMIVAHRMCQIVWRVQRARPLGSG